MGLGKQVRLNRVFGHASGRLCSVAIDHFMGYTAEMPAGLRDLRKALAELMPAKPDALTMHKGMASALWTPYAGQVPLIIQSSLIRPDDSAQHQAATVEEALRLGADALAVAAFVRGPTEAHYLQVVADHVREAARLDFPVICHIYPRSFVGKPQIVFHPEEIAWAARCAVEVGADVVKTPFCGDVAAYAQIVGDCPVPLVAAGGPQTATLRDALRTMAGAIEAGARGATIGRNIWGFTPMAGALQAFQAVIHDRATPDEALRLTGLQ